MKIAFCGKEYLEIDEKSLLFEKPEQKIHLIKFTFDNPNDDKINKVIDKFDDTNRFIIDDNIKYYNNILKTFNKKYYIENNGSQKIITFFKRNNKVLLNMLNLNKSEYKYVIDNLDDVLYNVEVIRMNKQMFEKIKEKIENFNWNGNIIL